MIVDYYVVNYVEYFLPDEYVGPCTLRSSTPLYGSLDILTPFLWIRESWAPVLAFNLLLRLDKLLHDSSAGRLIIFFWL